MWKIIIYEMKINEMIYVYNENMKRNENILMKPIINEIWNILI